MWEALNRERTNGLATRYLSSISCCVYRLGGLAVPTERIRGRLATYPLGSLQRLYTRREACWVKPHGLGVNYFSNGAFILAVRNTLFSTCGSPGNRADMSSSTQESDEEIGLEQASNPEDAPAASAVDDSISDHEQSASEDGAEAEETEPNVLGVSDEHALGDSEQGRSINEGLRALSRAARSFLIYDTNNDAIRLFLEDYREAMETALLYGPVSLEIRPFELVMGNEVVYLDRNRERSLAFRMFRDGVRRLEIEPNVPWSELLKLLEILSVRYTGVRQNEDDIVTLLWKAGFQEIEIVAVEGFVPEEEEEGALQSQEAREI